MEQFMSHGRSPEQEELFAQFKRIRRSLRQCIWMSAATNVLLLYLLVFD